MFSRLAEIKREIDKSVLAGEHFAAVAVRCHVYGVAISICEKWRHWKLGPLCVRETGVRVGEKAARRGHEGLPGIEDYAKERLARTKAARLTCEFSMPPVRGPVGRDIKPPIGVVGSRIVRARGVDQALVVVLIYGEELVGGVVAEPRIRIVDSSARLLPGVAGISGFPDTGTDRDRVKHFVGERVNQQFLDSTARIP